MGKWLEVRGAHPLSPTLFILLLLSLEMGVRPLFGVHPRVSIRSVASRPYPWLLGLIALLTGR